MKKPKDLKYPFKWEERKPALVDRVLFVPNYYEKHDEWTLPDWEDPLLFGKKAPVYIEYCAGNGSWIIEKALEFKDVNWVAVEKRFDRVSKIWAKMKNLEVNNLLIVAAEALTFTRYYVPSNTIQKIFINFPDPWPKDKHAKNRLVKEPFLSEMARIASLSTTLTLVTDHIHYSRQVIDSFLIHPHWRPSFPDPYFKTEWEGYGTSYFDTLWRKQGLKIHYIQFEKAGET